jgi:hypothetical protein
MNSNLRKIQALNAVGSVDTILSQFDPKVSTQEGDNKYMIKQVPSPTQKPISGKSEIEIPLTDSNLCCC